jgi:hypothetical protein
MVRSRLVPLIVIVLLMAVTAAAQQPVVSYEIDVVLDPETHRLEASQRVRWTNTTGVATSELWWHLYLNAFASNRTTFMREVDGRGFRSPGGIGEDGWGWVRITSLTLDDGSDLLPAIEFLRPDDDNVDDFTVARVELPRQVPPGAAVEVELDFEAQLPEVFARTGHAGDFHLVGQWFPKLGVFEGERGWNCHQFHAAGEFYADFGSYRVTVSVPQAWVVGATGVEVERAVDGDRQRLVFAADRVHDFAWTAAPEALMAVVETDFEPGRDVPTIWLERVGRLLGKSAAELELPPMHLRLLLPRGQQALADRIVRAIRLSVAWYGLHYGPYPYPQLTVVSPPPGAGEAGGMEYPTFITTGAGLLSSLPVLGRLPWIEAVTVHEFGHQYFQGLLASNESEQGWLDEGLNSYAEVECMEAIGSDDLMPIVDLFGPWMRTRSAMRLARVPLVIDSEPWRFRSFREYAVASFDKTASALKTLEGLIGADRFAVAMRSYADRYRFAHPNGDDLFELFEEVAESELGWFFDQAFRSDVEVDWSVLKVSDRQGDSPRGMEWNGSEWAEIAPQGDDSAPRTAAVEVGRLGDFVGPVEVLLGFADGSEQRRTWDGRERWVRWRIPSEHRLNQVIVDPDGVWALEIERANNYWRDQADPSLVRRSLWWIVDALQLLGLVHLSWS